jgi:hypothetical protein
MKTKATEGSYNNKQLPLDFSTHTQCIEKLSNVVSFERALNNRGAANYSTVATKALQKLTAHSRSLPW